MIATHATGFEWDEIKNRSNFEKHGIAFEHAQYAFTDKQRVVVEDLDHSTPKERRYFCIGMADENIVTVSFTWRHNKIRIFGAGYWRKGKQIYEKENS